MASKFRPIFAKNFGKLGMFWKQLSADISADNIGKSGRLSVSADIDFSCIGRSLMRIFGQRDILWDIGTYLDTTVIEWILLLKLFCLWVILQENVSKPSMVYA